MSFTAEKEGFKIVMNGKGELIDLKLPENISEKGTEYAAGTLLEMIQESIKESHRIAADETRQATGFNLPV